MAKNKKIIAFGSGKRKTSVARTYLYDGKGKISINSRSIDDVKNYFFKENLAYLIFPLVLTGNAKKYDVRISVRGGGIKAQLDAIRYSLARTLLEAGADRQILKNNKLLKRDDRRKERKKYGLKGARRAPQFSKR